MKIVCIGAGNLAWHLTQELIRAGNSVLQIYSRQEVKARALATKLNANHTDDLRKIVSGADLYVFAVADSALSELNLNKDLKKTIANQLCVHTSGSINLKVIENLSSKIGVFYPLQTFSTEVNVNFKEIPICVEANTLESQELLMKLATTISAKVSSINSEQRAQIHLAAVFACNFTNHLYAIAEGILTQKDIDFDLLKPLIKVTTEKALSAVSPADVQTGPAIRDDKATLEQQQQALEGHPELQLIYNKISESILSHELLIKS